MSKEKKGMIALLVIFLLIGLWRKYYTDGNLPLPEREIKVHIAGAIKNPGVYQINEKDRLEILIERAGGLLDEAKTEDLNLARILLDGERIDIPSIQETPDTKELKALPQDLAFWESVPGIGKQTASFIMEYLQKHPQAQLEDLIEVSGIGTKRLQDIRAHFEKEGLL